MVAWKQPARVGSILLKIGSNDVNQRYLLDETPRRLEGLVEHLLDEQAGVHPGARLYMG